VFGAKAGKEEFLNLVVLLGGFSWSHSFRYRQLIYNTHLYILLRAFFLLKIQDYQCHENRSICFVSIVT